MTNQNITSPALYHQNQPPDSGSVHESQEALGIAASQPPLYMRCVFLFRVFYNFQWRGEAPRPRTSPSLQKFVSADDKSKHKHAQPFITRTNILTLALYMSHIGGSFGYRGIAGTAIHAVCVFCLKVSYIFRGDKKRSLYCSSSGHQKSVSADDKSKHNKPSPLSPEPTS